VPIYSFELSDGTCRTADDVGVSLPDRTHAFEYARGVVRELMACQEAQTRWWRLDIYDKSAGEKIFEIPFASVDSTLDYLAPERRMTMVGLYDRVRALKEVIASANITMRESCALVARSRGRPYLAAYRGERTIRDC
jgi:hypothetical protein